MEANNEQIKPAEEDVQRTSVPGRADNRLYGSNSVLPGVLFRFRGGAAVYANATNGKTDKAGNPVLSGIRRIGGKPRNKFERRRLRQQQEREHKAQLNAAEQVLTDDAAVLEHLAD